MTAAAPSPHIAILTVTTNAELHLGPYFDALTAITYPNWSLWLVDNASTDHSLAIARERCPSATIIPNARNLGFTGACNRALALLPDRPDIDYVLFLNDDTEVEPGFLQPLLARAGPHVMTAPKTYLAGRRGYLDDSAGTFDWWRGAWKRRTLGRRETPRDNRPRLVESANLSCLLVPRAVFSAIGLLDDAFFVYYDDTDFCRRARLAGFRLVYEPRSVVFHRKGATIGGQLSAVGCYYLTRNRPYLVRKHRNRAQFGVFMAWFLATRAVRMGAWSLSGRRDLVGATLAGLRDFARRRMGART